VCTATGQPSRPSCLAFWLHPPGLGLGVFALAAFLTPHPLKLWLADLRRDKQFPRTSTARRSALLYGAIGVSDLTLAFITAKGGFWWPPSFALPWIDHQPRFTAHYLCLNLIPQTAGAAAMGSVAAGIGLAPGASRPSLRWGCGWCWRCAHLQPSTML